MRVLIWCGGRIFVLDFRMDAGIDRPSLKERRLQYATVKRYYAKIQNATELNTSKRVLHNLMHIMPGLIVLQL